MSGSKRPQEASLVRAVNEYQRTIELDPTRADAYAALGGALLELNRYEEAKRALTRACQLRPDLPDYRIALSTRWRRTVPRTRAWRSSWARDGQPVAGSKP